MIIMATKMYKHLQILITMIRMIVITIMITVLTMTVITKKKRI